MGDMRLAGWTGVVWCVMTAAGWAQPPGVEAPIHAAPNQVGVAAAVQGNVQLARPTQVGHIAKSGEPVFLNDTITTDAQSHLQIMLLDQTIFTIGPNSAIVIDTFVYDPNTDAGKVSATIVKGVFRFVSGRIAHQNPENMKVKLPTGTIGVRGTIVSGVVEGDTATVALIGPGSITVSNAGTSVDIGRVGFGTTIGGITSAPTIPAFVPPAQMQAMAQALGPMIEARAAQQGSSEQAASQQQGGTEGPSSQTAPTQAGQGTTPSATGQFGSFQGQPGQMPSGFSMEQAGQYAAMMGSGAFGQFGQPGTEGSFGQMGGMMMGQMGGPMMMGMTGQFGTAGFYGGNFSSFNTTGFFGFFSGTTTSTPPLNSTQTTSGQTSQILAGITKLDELRTIQTGVGHFSRIDPNGFTQTSPGGTRTGSMRVDFDIDFGSRTVGGGNSKLVIAVASGPSPINQTMNLTSQSFATGTGNAVFSQTAGGLTGTFTLNNTPGVIANNLTATATFSQGNQQGSGTMTNIAGSSGPSP